MTGYYHSHCFKCKLCQKPLSHCEYSVDQENQVCYNNSGLVTPPVVLQVYCLEDYCYLFGPKCGKCLKTIYPVDDTSLIIRVKAGARVRWVGLEIIFIFI